MPQILLFGSQELQETFRPTRHSTRTILFSSLFNFRSSSLFRTPPFWTFRAPLFLPAFVDSSFKLYLLFFSFYDSNHPVELPVLQLFGFHFETNQLNWECGLISPIQATPRRGLPSPIYSNSSRNAPPFSLQHKSNIHPSTLKAARFQVRIFRGGVEASDDTSVMSNVETVMSDC